MPQNKQILLDNRPEGEAVASNFKLVVSETPALRDGQVLVRHPFRSLEPYMRGRMNDAKSYAGPQAGGRRRAGGGEVGGGQGPGRGERGWDAVNRERVKASGRPAEERRGHEGQRRTDNEDQRQVLLGHA